MTLILGIGNERVVLDTYTETDYNQYLETQEPGIGDRAGDQALNADLHRIGY
jgi:hypothetical protein